MTRMGIPHTSWGARRHGSPARGGRRVAWRTRVRGAGAGQQTDGRIRQLRRLSAKTAGVNFCVFATTTSGEFKIKKTTVPITKTITLQGGIIVNETKEPKRWSTRKTGNAVENP